MNQVPKQPDVLIIGGGIIGTLSALSLARRGARVAIVERGSPCRESSWAGAGILSPIYPWRYPEALSHLVNRSIALYPELASWLLEVSGTDPELRFTGMLLPVFRAAEWADLADALPWAGRFGWAVERLDGAQARAVEPCLAESVSGGVWFPGVGQVRNPRLSRAAEEAARALGVTFHDNRQVTGFSIRSGRVDRVHTDHGDFSGGQVLLAAGSWSGELAGELGLDLPVQPVKGQIVLLKDQPGRLSRIVKHDQAYLVPRADGRILVGATMEMAGFDRRTTLSALNRLSSAVLSICPSLAGCEVERHWMGFRPGTPDGLPYLGAVRGLSNLFVATGHYRNGVILAPATAEAMADLMLDDVPRPDLAAFRPERAAVAHAQLGFPAAV